MKKRLTEFSINHPWMVIIGVVLITAFFAAQLPKITIDTDPENMLEADEPARIFDHEVKRTFDIADFIAVGVVDEEGAFNQKLLTNIYHIIDEIKEIDGVIEDDILAPSTVDDIIQEDGILTVKTLLAKEPKSDEQAQYILGRIKDNPILRGKLASDDGKAIAMFIPIESKNMSHRIAGEIQTIIDKYSDGEEYFIAGLPVIISSYIPGQEEDNVRYVLEHQAGAYATDPLEIADIVRNWFLPGDLVLEQVVANASALARPDAARVIARRLYAMLEPGSALERDSEDLYAVEAPVSR